MGNLGNIKYIATALMLSGAAAVCAQSKPADISSLPLTPEVKVKAVKGYYRFVDEYGDTVRMTVLRDIYISSNEIQEQETGRILLENRTRRAEDSSIREIGVFHTLRDL